MDESIKMPGQKGRKRNAVGRCVLCVTDVDNLTREHLLPKNWYPPEQTTEKTIRQTFPSCFDCNNGLSSVEARLLQGMGLSLNPDSGAAAGIAKKVIHSLSMDEAPNEKEAYIRGRNKFKLLQNTTHFKRLDLASESEKPPKNAVVEPLRMMPGLNIRPEELASGHFSVSEIRQNDLQSLLEKIVRGVMYLEYDLYIEKDQQIILQRDRSDFFSWAECRTLVQLPGMIIRFSPFPDGTNAIMLFIIDIWDRFTFYVGVTPGENPIWADTLYGRRLPETRWDINTYSLAPEG